MEYREVQAMSQVITSQCREIHGDDKARNIAMVIVNEELKKYLSGWDKDKKAKFEVKLIFHRPLEEKKEGDES